MNEEQKKQVQRPEEQINTDLHKEETLHKGPDFSPYTEEESGEKLKEQANISRDLDYEGRLSDWKSTVTYRQEHQLAPLKELQMPTPNNRMVEKKRYVPKGDKYGTLSRREKHKLRGRQQDDRDAAVQAGYQNATKYTVSMSLDYSNAIFDYADYKDELLRGSTTKLADLRRNFPDPALFDKHYKEGGSNQPYDIGPMMKRLTELEAIQVRGEKSKEDGRDDERFYYIGGEYAACETMRVALGKATEALLRRNSVNTHFNYLSDREKAMDMKVLSKDLIEKYRELSANYKRDVYDKEVMKEHRRFIAQRYNEIPKFADKGFAERLQRDKEQFGFYFVYSNLSKKATALRDMINEPKNSKQLQKNSELVQKIYAEYLKAAHARDLSTLGLSYAEPTSSIIAEDIRNKATTHLGCFSPVPQTYEKRDHHAFDELTDKYGQILRYLLQDEKLDPEAAYLLDTEFGYRTKSREKVDALRYEATETAKGHIIVDDYAAQLKAESAQKELQEEAQAQALEGVQSKIEKELPAVVPPFTATVNDAYDLVHSEQRLGFFERRRVKKEMEARRESGAAVSREAKQTQERFDKSRALAISDFKDMGASISQGREALALMDLSGTREAGEKNAELFRKLTVGSNAEKLEVLNSSFDELLAVDPNTLCFANDRELLAKYPYIQELCIKGAELQNLIADAQRFGMVIPSEKIAKLKAKKSLFEVMSMTVNRKLALLQDPYYALIGEEAIDALSPDYAARLFDSVDINGPDTEKINFVNKLNQLKTFKTQSYQDEGFNEKADLRGYLSRLECKEREEKARERQVRFDAGSQIVEESWSVHYPTTQDGHTILSTIPQNGALTQGGLPGRPQTRVKIINCLTMNRFNKTYADKLSDNEKAQIPAIQQEVEDVLSKENTVDRAGAMMSEMAKGLLKNRVLIARNFNSFDDFFENLPTIGSFFAAMKDYEQCTEDKHGLTAVGKKARSLLGDEDRKELVEFKKLQTFFFEPLADYIAAFNHKTASGLSAGDQTLRGRPGSMGYLGFEPFFEDNKVFFANLSHALSATGRFVMPQDNINSTGLYWTVRVPATGGDLSKPMDPAMEKSLRDNEAAVKAEMFSDKGAEA